MVLIVGSVIITGLLLVVPVEVEEVPPVEVAVGVEVAVVPSKHIPSVFTN